MEDNYQNEEYQKDTIPESLFCTSKSHSEHGGAESVTTRSEDTDTDYEYIPDPIMLMRKLPTKELKIEQALFASSASKWREYGLLIITIDVLALLSLTMATATLVIALLRCFPSCPFEWHVFQEKCYYYSPNKETWENSRHICRNLNADLVVINSGQEQDFLVFNKQYKQSHWIGYSDLENEGSWKWVDGTNASYKYWASSEPNNNSGEEDCAVLEEEGNYKWHDAISPQVGEAN
ncbi:hypothetical protein EYD10_04923 [Varanus komodoensis]|nr:hypothetical protein EYD10_04923 [Varanus komodoensis]